MSSSSTAINFDKSSKKLCYRGTKGLRLNPKRFSVGRLRANFLILIGILRRWRNSYKNALRQLRRNMVRRRKQRDSLDNMEVGYNSYSSGRIRTMVHSNSFCSEAIADCLEFIKRNSVSVDDERHPMLKQN
ncbi:hypothetical protein OROHE_006021 [Orobanche hederae]